MHVKKGDNVRILAGDDAGKTGTIVSVERERNLVVVEGINMKKKRVRARRANEKGQTIDVAHPIHVSNVALASTQAKKKK